MEFRLAQIIAAIEKLDLSFNAVFMQTNDGGIQNSLDAFLDLLRSDRVISHIFSLIEDQCEKKPILDNWLKENTGYIYSLPNKITERTLLTRDLLTETVTKGRDLTVELTNSWYTGGIGVATTKFLQDFLGSLHRDLKNLLIDMRVEAELAQANRIFRISHHEHNLGEQCARCCMGDMNNGLWGPYSNASHLVDLALDTVTLKSLLQHLSMNSFCQSLLRT